METKYIVIVQCHIVTEKCPGFFCEQHFTKRTGAFTDYKDQPNIRSLTISCGGCCGRAVHRKLSLLLKTLKKKEGIEKENVIVHLSSCIVFDNFHAPPCAHVNYLRELINGKLGLEIRNGSKISELSEKRRVDGTYHCRN